MRYFALLSAVLMFGLMLAASLTGCKGNHFLPQPMYNATNTPTITPTLPPGTGGWTFGANLTDTVHPSNTQQWTFNSNPNSLTNSFSWDGSTGDPSPGSARLVIGFNGPNQKADFSLMTNNTPVNLAGKTCYVKYYLDSASSNNASYPNQIQIYIKDSGWRWHAVSQKMPTSPGWNAVIMDMNSAPSSIVTGSVNEVGIEVFTASNGSISYSPVTIHIDSWVWY